MVAMPPIIIPPFVPRFAGIAMPLRKPHRLRLESLEGRRVPATLAANLRSVTFTDIDGDAATVTFSQPVLGVGSVNSILKFDTGGVDGSTAPQQLQEIDLAGLRPGLSVTVSAVPAGGGNGTVDVGWINSTTVNDGRDEGLITISGDLGRITVGDSKVRTPGLRGLVVGSLGARGLATQAAGGTLATVVNGPLGKLTVAGDVVGASVAVGGAIGPVSIGGSLRADATAPGTGLISALGAIRSVTITGDIVGGGGDNSGLRAGSLGKVTIGGTIQGGAGADSASIVSNTGITSISVGASIKGSDGARSAQVIASGGNIGKVVVAKNVTGGVGIFSASIEADPSLGVGGKIGSVTITGDVTGNGLGSAAIRGANGIGTVHVGSLTGNGFGSAQISGGAGAVGKVTVDGDVTGGTADYSASLVAGTSIMGVTIGGNVTGSTGPKSAAIIAEAGNLGPVTIAGDLTGGGGDQSAIINAYDVQVGGTAAHPKFFGGKIASVTVTGDVTGGGGKYSGAVYAEGSIGKVTVGSLTGAGGYASGSIVAIKSAIKSVTVRGDVTGGNGDYSATIWAAGRLGPVAILGNGGAMHGDLTGGSGKYSALVHGLQVVSVTVAGSVTGGQGAGSASIHGVGSVGLVNVTHDWIGASIAAGVLPGSDGYFDTADDTAGRAPGTITGITIGGIADGTTAAFSSTDHFAFVGTQIKTLKIGGSAVPLKPGPSNDDLTLGTTGDFRLVEK
jgi:hypothetical protein